MKRQNPSMSNSWYVEEALKSLQTNNKKKKKVEWIDKENQQFTALKESQEETMSVHDCSHLELKKNFQDYPLLICPDGYLFLDACSPEYDKCKISLLTIADPLDRPKHFHRMKLTKFSLYSAMTLGWTSHEVMQFLLKYGKNVDIPDELRFFIETCMAKNEGAKLALFQGHYVLSLSQKTFSDFIRSNPQVSQNLKLVQRDELQEMQKQEQKFEEQNDETERDIEQYIWFDLNDEQTKGIGDKSEQQIVFINDNEYYAVAEAFVASNIPIMQRYHLNSKQKMDHLEMSLRWGVTLRPYQEAALDRIFRDEIAVSGLVIMPCGAGKTLLGIVSLCRIQRSTIIICDSDFSVHQWYEEIRKYTTISTDLVIKLTGNQKNYNIKGKSLESAIIITTYSMLAYRREQVKNPLLIFLAEKSDWGVCILDEVHKLPAKTFQTVLQKYKFDFKLGLTATPFREDKKIVDLLYMVGPKLFEENYQDLIEEGWLAKPYCVEVRCDMSQIFKNEYNQLRGPLRVLLHSANPKKFAVLQFLIKQHEDRGDKIIVFCDRPCILQYFSKILAIPTICGETQKAERQRILEYFAYSEDINTIFVSSIGDTSIDLPFANVGIQFGVHFKSRRQEVQRLGRILRPKVNAEGNYSAFWYNLISNQTDESTYCQKRQQCMVDLGFSYEIINEKDLPYNIDPTEHSYITELVEQDYFTDVVMMSQQDYQIINNNNSKQIKSDLPWINDGDEEIEFNRQDMGFTRPTNFGNSLIYFEEQSDNQPNTGNEG